MTDTLLIAVFSAIVQMESGGRLDARNGDAVGPAQIKPAAVRDLINWGHAVELRDRETLEGSFRIFRLYTDRWIAYRRIPDTPENRANIWRHGPSSKYVLKGESSTYSLKVESLLKTSHHPLVSEQPLKRESRLPRRRRSKSKSPSGSVEIYETAQGGRIQGL
jgi:hypothetical protein